MKSIYAVIADHYGYPAQSNQLIEECAELIQAVNKYRRARTKEEQEKALDNYIEEMADVEIMLEQMKYLLRVKEEQMDKVKQYKLKRTIERFEHD